MQHRRAVDKLHHQLLIVQLFSQDFYHHCLSDTPGKKKNLGQKINYFPFFEMDGHRFRKTTKLWQRELKISWNKVSFRKSTNDLNRSEKGKKLFYTFTVVFELFIWKNGSVLINFCLENSVWNTLSAPSLSFILSVLFATEWRSATVPQALLIVCFM